MKKKRVNKRELEELAKAERWYNITKNLSCALCGWFCNNMHHHNNWYELEPNKS